ncbi:SRPBCC family protein [Enteractinococcus helveticum]|uniref:ATPase n=1 Tax=Enteractinococcus helveticum TaxID=1837282 RepID=A0A1B7M1P3_9MICC|nr:SRPBCC family protein [Enteractinococcus helveticum]OAV62518.1 ATPase [Enteractinococcus helveticum]
MAITSIDTDRDALTITLVADFTVSQQRLWDAYMDARQLERFWGPPTWPATFTQHDVRVGGRTSYHMTGPEGEQSGGYWEFVTINPPHSFEVLDGFANPDGTPNADMPSMRMLLEFSEQTTGSRLTVTTTFDSVETLDQLLGMGMVEGTREAMGQIDDVVADDSVPEAARTTHLQLLGDTQARVTRFFEMNIDDVWRAHHDPGLMRQWMLGPEGWVLSVAKIGERPGDTYRYEWESETGEPGFGFTGEVLESHAPHREVNTERLIGAQGPGTLNAMNLVEVAGGTLLTLVITYPDAEMRNEILETGMADGMEASYARLEDLFRQAAA